MGRLISAFFAVGALLLTVGTASAKDMKVLASWDSSYAAVGEVLYPFIEYLEKETTKDLNISRFGPETIPPFEQMTPVSQGLFDMIYTNGGYHFNEIALGMSLDALSGSSEQLHETGIWDDVDQEYQKVGLKLIAVFYDRNGFHMVLKDPIGEDRLAGRRIRGTPLYHSVIEALGGSPVVLPGPEIYPALERGVVDGAAWPAVGALAFRWFEVAKYMVRPTFGQVSHILLMNLKSWNALDEKTQTEITTAARKYEVESSKIFDNLGVKEREALMAEGMKVTNLPSDVASGLKSAWFNGVLKLASKVNPDAVAQLKAKAIEAKIDQ